MKISLLLLAVLALSVACKSNTGEVSSNTAPVSNGTTVTLSKKTPRETGKIIFTSSHPISSIICDKPSNNSINFSTGSSDLRDNPTTSKNSSIAKVYEGSLSFDISLRSGSKLTRSESIDCEATNNKGQRGTGYISVSSDAGSFYLTQSNQRTANKVIMVADSGIVLQSASCTLESNSNYSNINVNATVQGNSVIVAVSGSGGNYQQGGSITISCTAESTDGATGSGSATINVGSTGTGYDSCVQSTDYSDGVSAILDILRGLWVCRRQ